MTNRMIGTFLLIVAAVGCSQAMGQAQALVGEAGGVAVTIYSSADPMGFNPQQFIAQQQQGQNPQYARQVPGFGVVRDTRRLELEQGVNLASFTDVAQFIDPTTVSLIDLSVPAAEQDEAGLKVVEQKFQFDLVSSQKLLEKYIDQQVTVNKGLGDGRIEQVTGTLLSNAGGQLVLKTEAGVRLLGWSNDVQLGELPGGLITRPTLQWQLWAPAAGARTVQTAYQTDGITWRSDYNLVLNHDDTKADLGAWVTILNLSGTRYVDAKLKLIAGDVRRLQRVDGINSSMKMARMAVDMAEAAPAGFEEKSFFEYHLYTLPRATTIDQNATQQIALFPTVRQFDVEKVLVYYGMPAAAHWYFSDPQTNRNLGGQSNKKIDVYIRFDNKEDNKLGMPLPKGKLRVFKADTVDKPGGEAAASTLEFVGEDLLDHTARNEQVLVKIGQSFDVTGTRVQTDFKVNNAARWMQESFKITLRNAKDKPQKVVIRESLYRWTNWQITQTTQDFEKIDARTIHFDVTVPPEGEKTVIFTVKYTW